MEFCMERKECSNGLQLIRIASLKLKGHFSSLFMGCLAMTTPLILSIVVPIMMAMLFEKVWIFTVGLIVFMIILGPLQVGHIRYFNDVIDGKQPRLRSVYSQFNFSGLTMRTIYVTILLVLMYLLGGVAYIIPAGFAISFFSMFPFFMERFKYDRLSTAMKDTASKMISNRLAMFSYKLIFYLVYFMLFVVCLLIILLVYYLSIDNLIIGWVVAVCGIIVFVFLYTMVTVYYHSSNQIFFEDVLSRDEKKRTKMKVSITQETIAMHDPNSSVDKAEKESVAKEQSNEKNEESRVEVEQTKTTKKSPSTKAKATTKSKTATKATTKKTSKDTTAKAGSKQETK